MLTDEERVTAHDELVEALGTIYDPCLGRGIEYQAIALNAAVRTLALVIGSMIRPEGREATLQACLNDCRLHFEDFAEVDAVRDIDTTGPAH